MIKRASFGYCLTLLFLATLVSFLFSINSTLAKSYNFQNWQVEADINQNATVLIKETITIDFRGQFSQFWREIDHKGLDKINEIKVRQNIDGEFASLDSYELDQNVSRTRIVINQSAKDEIKVYQIEYLVHGVIGYQSDWDEFYWNVTSSDIDVGIDRASILINLPQSIDSGDWQSQIYSQASNKEFEVVGQSTVGFSLTNIDPGDDFTIVLGWPKDVVDYRLNRTKIFQILSLIIFLISIIGLVIYNFFKRNRLGLNKSIAPEFVPPTDDSAIFVGGLIREKIEAAELTAALISMARKGYIKIIQKKKSKLFGSKFDYSFKKIKKDFRGLNQFEHKIAQKIFTDTDLVEASQLKDSFYTEYNKISGEVIKSMTKNNWFSYNPKTTKSIYVFLLILIIVVTVFSSAFLSSLMVGLPLLTISLGLSISIWLAFGLFSSKKTKKGVELWRKWLGFRMFLSKTERFKMAELDERSKMKDSNKNETEIGSSIFEQYLPYALVLGVADAWANRFKGFKLSQPEWLEGDIPSYSAVVLAGSVADLNKTTGSTILSSPSGGSGFGGGSGFSGGSAGGGAGGGGAGAS